MKNFSVLTSSRTLASALLGASVLFVAACGSTPAAGTAQTPTPDPMAAYCAAAKQVKSDSNAFTQATNNSSLSGLKSTLGATTKDISSTVAVAPAAVATDWKDLKAVFETFNTSVQTATDYKGAISAFFAEAMTPEAQKLNTEQNAIDAYTQTHCGFAISASPSASTATAPPDASGSGLPTPTP